MSLQLETSVIRPGIAQIQHVRKWPPDTGSVVRLSNEIRFQESVTKENKGARNAGSLNNANMTSILITLSERKENTRLIATLSGILHTYYTNQWKGTK